MMPISIHALLAESDFRGWTLNINGPIFLSTLSLRRATPKVIREPTATGFLSTLSLRRATGISACHRGTLRISIHALLAESDSAPRFTPAPSRNFYPRSPCGERRQTAYFFEQAEEFLSTLSLRRATAADISTRREANISIHALLAESDKFKMPVPT